MGEEVFDDFDDLRVLDLGDFAVGLLNVDVALDLRVDAVLYDKFLEGDVDF